MKLFRLRINFVGRCNHGYSTLSGNISALNFSLFPKGSEEDSWMNSRTWERYRSTRLLSALSLFLSLGRAHLYACSILSRSKQALTKRRVLACSVERRVSFRAGVRRSSAPRERFLFKLLVVQLCEGKKKPSFRSSDCMFWGGISRWKVTEIRFVARRSDAGHFRAPFVLAVSCVRAWFWCENCIA